MTAWKTHLYRVGTSAVEFDKPPDKPSEHRRAIEPWLSAVFQSEHLSLLVGNGFTTAIALAAGVPAARMDVVELNSEYETQITEYADKTAKAFGRGKANIEDQIRAAIALISGFDILDTTKSKQLKDLVDKALHDLLGSVLQTERGIREALDKDAANGQKARLLLTSFLLSFASRAASRERLHLFTTNYDRLIEHGGDLVGLRIVDRFVGSLSPVFRASRLDVDLHYNPPGIRGEPRYLEGVVKLTKLHGSVDWRFENNSLRRYGIPFGAQVDHPELPKKPFASVMIYPNPAKDVETLEYPYAELFRDFSAALCRPNSVLVTYGYGFGDDHINRVIRDMLTIPSVHLVIISYSDVDKRISGFCDSVGRNAQVSLLVGSHFGDMATLVENYLPKPAIDQITWRQTEIMKHRDETHRGPEDMAGVVIPGKE